MTRATSISEDGGTGDETSDSATKILDTSGAVVGGQETPENSGTREKNFGEVGPGPADKTPPVTNAEQKESDVSIAEVALRSIEKEGATETEHSGGDSEIPNTWKAVASGKQTPDRSGPRVTPSGEVDSEAGDKVPPVTKAEREDSEMSAAAAEPTSVGEHDAQRADSVGPFGIAQGNGDPPFNFIYYFKPGRTPTDEQATLALRIDSLMQQLERFKDDPTAIILAGQLMKIFEAGLVQKSTLNPRVFDGHVTALEKDFLSRVVTPAHRKRISSPTFNTFYALVATSAAGFFLDIFIKPSEDNQIWFNYTHVFSSLLFVIAGTLLGRLFFMVATHQSQIVTVEQFDMDGIRIGTGGFVIFLDAIVGMIAFLVFYTGFLQIAIGAEEVSGNTEQVRSALSTLEIKSDPSVAYLFGLIVGVARNQFVTRVTSLARERLE